VGPAIALLLLSWTGFDSSASATYTEESLTGLRVLYSFGTPVFYSLAALTIWKYPLTEARQRRIRNALERRAQKTNLTLRRLE
jgi:Na+/melibiose symporter-like transporter